MSDLDSKKNSDTYDQELQFDVKYVKIDPMVQKLSVFYRVRIKGSHFAKCEANPNICEAFFLKQ